MNQQRDVIDLLLQDHEEVRDLLARIDDTAPEERGELFQQIVSELARHEAAEEAIVHPTVRREVDGGDDIADARTGEESEAEELMAEMERMDASSPEFLEKLRRLRDDVLEHAESEEAEEFPRLRETVSEDRLREMAEGFERMKSMAPTHPHPNTPPTPEAQVAAGPVAGAFDRARDAAREIFSTS